MNGPMAPGTSTRASRLSYIGESYFRACNSEITERATEADDQLIVAGYFSTSDPDVDDFVIHAEGWNAGLDTFLTKNPRFLWMHDPLTPIGNVVHAKTDGRGLFGRVQFDDQDEFARKLHSKVKRGFLDTFSVGFRATIEPEFDKDSGQLHFRGQQLMENSLVTIPAQINAGVTERSFDEDALCQRMIGLAGDKWSRAAEKALGEIAVRVKQDITEFAEKTRGQFLSSDEAKDQLAIAVAEAIQARVGTLAQLVSKSADAKAVADALKNFTLKAEA